MLLGSLSVLTPADPRNAPGHATPLMIASRRGHSRIVELLLAHPDCDTGLVDRLKYFLSRLLDIF